MARILLAVHPRCYGVVLEGSVVEDLTRLAEVERMDDWWPRERSDGAPRYAERVARSGAEIEFGRPEDGKVQSSTLNFRMSGVDSAAFEKWMEEDSSSPSTTNPLIPPLSRLSLLISSK